MWNRLELGRREPIWLLLQTTIYGCAALLIVTSISSGAGVASSMLAAVFGVIASAYLADSRVRKIVIVSVSAVSFLVGFFAESFLGRFELPARIVGVPAMCHVMDAATFGLMTFGAVLMLRSLARQYSVASMIEVTAVGAGTVMLFSGHRDMRFGRPRFLVDWATTRGHDPVQVLIVLGLITLLAILLMLVRQTNRRQTFGIAVWLTMLFFVGGLAISSISPVALLALGQSPQGQPEEKPTGGGESEQDPSHTTPPPSRGDNQPPQPPRDKSWPPPPPPPDDQHSQPVAVVLLREDVEPYEGRWYFRQNACSQFNGMRLVRATNSRTDLDVPLRLPTSRHEIHGVPQPEYFTESIPNTVNVIGEIGRPFCLTCPVRLAPHHNPDLNYFRTSYEVTSRMLVNPVANGKRYDLYATLAQHNAGNPSWTKEERREYLTLPDDPRYQELAEEIVRTNSQAANEEVATQTSPMLRALAVGRWIQENTTYTRKPGHRATDDQAAEFLFGNRRGYCVHIAHSVAYLLRSIDIPARVCTGYMVPASRSGRMSAVYIQNTDAHAWPEIYLEGVGWVVVDTFPADRAPEDATPSEPDQGTVKFWADRARQKPIDPREEFSPQRSDLASTLSWILMLTPVAALGSLYSIKTWRRLSHRMVKQHKLYLVCYRFIIRRSVRVAPVIHECLVDIACALREDSRVAQGISTRSFVVTLPALQVRALTQRRGYVSHEDVRALATALFSHRLELAPGVNDADAVVVDCMQPVMEQMARKTLR